MTIILTILGLYWFISSFIFFGSVTPSTTTPTITEVLVILISSMLIGWVALPIIIGVKLRD